MKKLLFVDDEQHVLDGLRDALRPQRREWSMRFVDSGAAALEAIDHAPPDVVVSDMRMPAMDGATLLTQVQDRCPQTVRIVLSGFAQGQIAARAGSVAHVVLAKPCSIDELRQTIERCCRLRDLVEPGGLRDALGATQLPAAPAVYRRLVALLADTDPAPQAISAILLEDVALAAKVLHFANSPVFGRGRAVTNFEDAVDDLGPETIKALVLTAGTFEELVPAQPFPLEALRQHSLRVARTAKRIAGEGPLAQDAFTAALLHDVGKLLLAARAPAYLAEVATTAADGNRSLVGVELRRSGISHAELGAHLLGLWGIPQTVLEAVAHHHRAARSDSTEVDAALIVHVANGLVRHLEGDSSAEELDIGLLAEHGILGELPRWRQMAAEEVFGAVPGGNRAAA